MASSARRKKESILESERESLVPEVDDTIAVCWDLEGSNLWWSASVIEVVRFDSPSNGSLGRGIILYKRLGKYAPEHATVDFKFSETAGRLVMQTYEGSTRVMSWKEMRPPRHHSVQNFTGRKSKLGKMTKKSSSATPQPGTTTRQVGVKVKRQSLAVKDVTPARSRKSRRLAAKNENQVVEVLGVTNVEHRGTETATASRIVDDDDEIRPAPPKLGAGNDDNEGVISAQDVDSSLDTRKPRAGSHDNDVEVVARVCSSDHSVLDNRVDDHRNQAVLQEQANSFFDKFITVSQGFMNKVRDDAFYDYAAQMVVQELRIDLVSEFHKNFRPSPSAQVSTGNLHQKCLRLSVSCSLSTFSRVAKLIRSSPAADDVRFYPSYEQTQNPSISSERFTVYFKSLKSLANALGFNDNRDFSTLHWREKCHGGVFYTRILGCLETCNDAILSSSPSSGSTGLVEKKSCTSSTATMAQKTQEEEGETQIERVASRDRAKDADFIFVGLSMNAQFADCTPAQGVAENIPGSSEVNTTETNAVTVPNANPDNKGVQPDENRSGDGGARVKKEEAEAGQEVPHDTTSTLALSRKRTLWDDESNSFLSHWECHTAELTVRPPPDRFFSRRDKRLDGVFALRWEPKAVPRTSAWTADAFRTDGHIFGKLEVFVPWVLLTGEQCVELGDILSKKRFNIRP